jgi:hypothetical protein
MFFICSHFAMKTVQHVRLAEHIDAALAAMPPSTASRLTHPDAAQRRTAIAIMAQTLAARIDGDRDWSADRQSVSPYLPIDL